MKIKQFLILFVALFATVFPGRAQEEFEYTHEGSTLKYYYDYWMDNGKVSVSGYTSLSPNLVIPSQVEFEGKQYSVEHIFWGAFSRCTGLTSVVIPNSVTTIGDWAFSGCSGLTSVVIPNSVTTIQKYAFSGCNGLASVVIPNSVTSIGDCAFRDCTGLNSVVIPNSVTTIGQAAFEVCSSLTSVVIPNSVTTIGWGAFAGCSGLTSVVVPNSVTTIEGGTFYFCSSLTSVVIPNSVTTIGESAFSDCGLNSLTLPTSIKVIGKSAFKGNPLVNLVIKGAEEIKTGAFSDMRSPSVVLPAGVKKIGDRAFGDKIELITINSLEPPILNSPCMGYSSDEEIDRMLVVCADKNSANKYRADEKWGEFMIVGKNENRGVVHMTGTGRTLSEEIMEQTRIMPGNITNLKITGKLTEKDWVLLNRNLVRCYDLDLSELDCTEIPANAFQGMKRLQMVLLPNKVVSVPQQAFAGCSSLVSVKLGDNVVSVGVEAFKGCNSLVSVKLGDKVTAIGDRAFEGCSSLRFMELAASLESIGTRSFAGTNCIQNFTAPSALTFIGNGAFEGCGALRSVDVTATELTNIPEGAFRNCGHLREVALPESLERIESGAFAATALNSVVIPDKVASIGEGAFADSKLLAVYLSAKMNEVSANAFSNCKLMNSVSLGRRIKSLGEGAFAGNSNMVNLSIPSPVPPAVEASTFEGVSKRKCSVAIPTVNFWDYLNAPIWGGFSQLNNDLSVEADISDNAEVSVAEEAFAEALEAIVSAEEDKAAAEEKSDIAVNDAIAEQNGIEQPAQARRRAAAPGRQEGISLAGGFMRIENGQKFMVSDSNKGYRFHIKPRNGAEIASVTLDGEELKDKITSDGYLTVDKIENIGQLVVKTIGGSSIEEVVAEGDAVGDDRIYDLTGRVVVNPGPGIYIKNGKKFLLK